MLVIIDKKILYPIAYSLVSLCFLAWIMPFYTGGDQEHYVAFFDNCILSEYSIKDKFSCYSAYLDSQEPGYFIIMNTLAYFLDKFYIILIANTLLIYLILRLIFTRIKPGYQRHILSTFIISNFYVLVLYLSAERLKFAFIFLFLALLVKKNKYLLSFLAMMTHSQIIILFISGLLGQIKELSLSLWKKTGMFAGAIFVLGAIFYSNQAHILRKFNAYSNYDSGDIGLAALMKVFVLYIVTVFSVRNWVVAIGGVPLLISSYLLGSSRIMILMFVFYIVSVLYYKRRMDLAMFFVLSYFSYKSIGFIQNILIYGDGFNIR